MAKDHWDLSIGRTPTIVNFVDSNILLYATSQQRIDEPKRHIAQTLLEAEHLILSVQVLNEFINVATHPKKHGMTKVEAAAHCEVFSKYHTVISLTPAVRDLAMTWFIPSQLSLWDANLIAAANLASCPIFYTEDLNHGQTFGNVTIVNPFASLKEP